MSPINHMRQQAAIQINLCVEMACNFYLSQGRPPLKNYVSVVLPAFPPDPECRTPHPFPALILLVEMSKQLHARFKQKAYLDVNYAKATLVIKFEANLVKQLSSEVKTYGTDAVPKPGTNGNANRIILPGQEEGPGAA